MAFGAKICAACGSEVGVQEHHLRPQVHGGRSLPTVWLCFVCHGLTHDVRRAPNHSELTAAGIAVGKIRRSKPVEPPPALEGKAASMSAALHARRAISTAHAAAVWPAIQRARACGAKSLREIGAVLEAAGVRMANGGKTWEPTSVKRVIDRYEAGPPPDLVIRPNKPKPSAARVKHDRLVAALDAAWLSGCRGAAQVAGFLNNDGVPCGKPGERWTAEKVRNRPEYKFQAVTHLQTSVLD